LVGRVDLGNSPPVSRYRIMEGTAMFDLSMGIWEFVLRAAIVYSFLFAMLRLGGKKHVGELTPFDLVVLLIISETVQGSMVGDDKSLIGGLIAAATLFALVYTVNYLSWRSKTAERLFEGAPTVLVRNGNVLRDALALERITRSELIEALRREGCTSLTRVRFAVLETDGSITVGLRCDR
jgi:uncharacterized membrane protein YcaP (DUF421 family)